MELKLRPVRPFLCALACLLLACGGTLSGGTHAPSDGSHAGSDESPIATCDGGRCSGADACDSCLVTSDGGGGGEGGLFEGGVVGGGGVLDARILPEAAVRPRADGGKPSADAARPRDRGLAVADAPARRDSGVTSTCGDKTCAGGETCASCPGDCGSCVVPESWSACLARSGSTTTVVSGAQGVFKNAAPPASWNLDLTQATFTGYPAVSTTGVSVGTTTAGARQCIGGGIVIGQQSRSLTWKDMHDTIGGGGYRITTRPGEWARIDGIRVDNVEDALKPRGPDGRWELWNAYMTYIRDDCIENDETAPGSVHDSLFDGCYTGFSEQEQSGCCDASPGEVFVVERSLMRLQKMPGPYNNNDPSVYGHGKFFKWQTPVPHPVRISDSIFMTELPPTSSSNWPFPPGTVTTNVTIVWLGPGAWTWPVPQGTTVTTDRSVWDRARQRWLDRHGCTSFTSCTKLLNPDPWP